MSSLNRFQISIQPVGEIPEVKDLENVRVTTSLVKGVSLGSKPSVDVLLDLLAKENLLYYYERGDTD